MMITEVKKDFFPFISNPFECLCNSVSFENQIASDTNLGFHELDWCYFHCLKADHRAVRICTADVTLAGCVRTRAEVLCQ